MSSLFSHSPEPESVSNVQIDSRTSAVEVPVPISEAFDGFTDGIHLWWPMETHSHFGAEAHVGFEAGVLLEDGFSGSQESWGEVTAWEAPTSLVIKWQLGFSPLNSTRVQVNFQELSENSTTVTLVQDGWTPGIVGVEQYEKYCDWPLILARYARFMGGTPSLD